MSAEPRVTEHVSPRSGRGILIEHATVRGYLKHRRYDVPHEVCEGACRQAWTDHHRQRRQQR